MPQQARRQAALLLVEKPRFELVILLLNQFDLSSADVQFIFVLLSGVVDAITDGF